MWILSWLPDFVFHLMVIVGVLGIVASWFFGFVPFIGQYKLPIQIISILILLFGIWVEGANSNNNSWLLKVKELEIKLARAETQSANVNTILVEKILEKEKIIKDKQNELKNAINKYATDECKLSNASVSLFNSSSQNELPDSTINTITGTSEVKIAGLLNTVNDNNATYYKIVEIVKAWQLWYKENKKIFDSVQ
jgi:hypothetical protein